MCMVLGLVLTMKEVMPSVAHKFCVMHLWCNSSKQWKYRELRGLYWQCAMLSTIAEFNVQVEAVKRKNDKAWAYLDKWDKDS